MHPIFSTHRSPSAKALTPLLPASLALLLPMLGTVKADQLLESGSFERPSVKGRTSVKDGANPVKPGVFSNWRIFTQPPHAEGKGSLTTGFTNETARTGKQSLYVAFDGYTALNSGMLLSTDLLPIQKGGQYRVGIWGRIDKKNPLTFDQRFPFLTLLVEFYTADGETITGEPFVKTQALPDDPNHNRNKPPLFSTDTWSQFFVDVTAPEDAEYVKITWECKVVKQAGKTTGVIYFDDATLEGPKPQEAAETEIPELKQTEAAKPTASGNTADPAKSGTKPGK